MIRREPGPAVAGRPGERWTAIATGPRARRRRTGAAGTASAPARCRGLGAAGRGPKPGGAAPARSRRLAPAPPAVAGRRCRSPSGSSSGRSVAGGLRAGSADVAARPSATAPRRRRRRRGRRARRMPAPDASRSIRRSPRSPAAVRVPGGAAEERREAIVAALEEAEIADVRVEALPFAVTTTRVGYYLGRTGERPRRWRGWSGRCPPATARSVTTASCSTTRNRAASTFGSASDTHSG